MSPEEMVVHTLVPELSDQQHKLLKTAVVPAVAAVVLGVLVVRLCAGPKSLGLAKTTPFFLRSVVWGRPTETRAAASLLVGIG
jgi:hypothetical protein